MTDPLPSTPEQRLTEAERALIEARVKLTTAEASGAATAQKLADLEARYKDALERLEQAQRAGAGPRPGWLE